MNLYLISQSANGGYDTFDSCVVAAKDELAARLTHPNNWSLDGDTTAYQWDTKNQIWSYTCDSGYVMKDSYTWASPADVKVKLIGTTDLEAGVICASFNAG